MDKFCFCGKPIPKRMRLCKEHAAEFGTDPQKWKPFLRFLVEDNQREWNAYQNSREINDCDIEIIHQDPRVTLLERFDGDGFIILRGCEDCD